MLFSFLERLRAASGLMGQSEISSENSSRYGSVSRYTQADLPSSGVHYTRL
ncbi:hypothetical protein MRBBS_2891 [Marinobacter sp. BSs20148]|nr:hypothetical protein MRBBS_2891 [Marinobacter sp. BSs20148]